MQMFFFSKSKSHNGPKMDFKVKKIPVVMKKMQFYYIYFTVQHCIKIISLLKSMHL